jgi:phenylacetate-CoA ligase
VIYRLKHLLNKTRNREWFQYLKVLLDNESMSRTRLLEKQQKDLADILSFAVENTEFYHRKYNTPHLQEKHINDISILPMLSKNDVLACRDRMVPYGINKNDLRIGNTGGSTGIPLSFYYDNSKIELMRAGMCRSYMWSGWRPGQKILNFWGAKQDIKNYTDLSGKFNSYISAEKTISAYEYTEKQMYEWVQSIHSYKPVLLQGYASILAELSKYIIEQRLTVPNTIVGVFSTAEVLYDWQREIIESVFSCKVFNQYGSREIPNIACECRHGNLHVFTDMVYLESVAVNNEKKLLVTSLTNRVMPFIRYDIGDYGKLLDGECPCGSPFPLMEMGLCRSNDLLTAGNGKVIYPSYFIHLLDGVRGIKQYQFIQTEKNKIVLAMNTSTGFNPDTLKGIRERVKIEIDRNMVLEIDYVYEIKRTLSGKHRFVINKIS